MKTHDMMWCKLLLGGLLVLAGLSLDAQAAYRLPVRAGRLVLHNVNEVVVVGYPGTEIVFTAEGEGCTPNARSQGLRQINARGQVDNTGLGLAVKQQEGRIEVGQITRDSRRYRIQVPAQMAIYYGHSTSQGSEIHIENLAGEVEVDCQNNDVWLRNCTGPVAVSTVHGEISAEYKGIAPRNDISLYSVYGTVELSVPRTARAEFRLRASNGNMYTDLDLQMVEPQLITTKSGDCKDCPKSSRIIGKLNGGGVLININSTYENIYLRQN